MFSLFHLQFILLCYIKISKKIIYEVNMYVNIKKSMVLYYKKDIEDINHISYFSKYVYNDFKYNIYKEINR